MINRNALTLIIAHITMAFLTFSCKNSTKTNSENQISDKEILLEYLNDLKSNKINDAYILLDDSCKSNVSDRSFEVQNKNVYIGSTFSIIKESHEKDTLKNISTFEMLNKFYDSTYKDSISIIMKISLIQQKDKWKIIYYSEKLSDYLFNDDHIRNYRWYSKITKNANADRASKELTTIGRWYYEGKHIIIERKNIFRNRVHSTVKNTCTINDSLLTSIKEESDNLFNGYNLYEDNNILFKLPSYNNKKRWENIYEKQKHSFISEKSVYKYKGKYHKAIKVTCLVEFVTDNGEYDKYITIEFYAYKIGRVKSTQYSELMDEALSEEIELN